MKLLAAFRETPESPLVACWVVARRKNGMFVCREDRKQHAGVFMARRDQIIPPRIINPDMVGYWFRENLTSKGDQ